jgi:hypothetical protein
MRSRLFSAAAPVLGKAILFLGATAASSMGEAVRPGPEKPDSTDYAVYSSVLAQHYDRGLPTPLIVLGESVDGPDDAVIDEHYRLMLQSALSPLSAETVAALEGTQATPRPISAEMSLRRPYLIMSRAVRDSLFVVCPGGWPRFAGKYPDARGYITLSRVAFDPERSQALVYSEDRCGMGCGEGTFLFLRRIAGGWKVTKKLTVWVQ